MSIKNRIFKMYDKYHSELLEIQPIQKRRYAHLSPHYDDIESEILYMFIRELRPNHIIEFSPYHGWSTSWILEALNKNKNGKCRSYDLHNSSFIKLNKLKNLDLSRWKLIQGDVQDHYQYFNFDSVDFIFIDSDHSKKFTKKYIEEVLIPAEETLKELKIKVPVFIHDVFGRFESSRNEGSLVKEFIKGRDYFTPSILNKDRKELNDIRSKFSLSKTSIHNSKVNPVVVFEIGFN